ncbi:MAG: XylR N-terminal domain-containing protein [Myxococcales bacterium]|nr:XylR N-terminal domain-containing protein [Myxococcales bacterium]
MNDASAGLRFAGSRALLYSDIAVDMLRQQLVHQVGEDLARSIVAQAGRKAGWSDAQLLLQERSFANLEAMVEAQYQLLSASGFGQFEVLSLAIDLSAREAYVRARCLGSPEAQSHSRLFGDVKVPACWHLVGYSTGWIASMTGLPLLTVESRCAAQGAEHCEFETLPYDDFVGPEAAFWKRAFESTSTSIAQELADKLATIEEQIATIRAQRSTLAQLSAPILQVTRELLVLPMIGAIDDARARIVSDKLLTAVTRRAARGVILDVTGVESLDTAGARSLLAMARAARLLGASVVVTGIASEVAQVLVTQEIDLAGLETRSSLRDGIRYLESRLGARRR